MITAGLTGNFGMGKSVVSRIFKELGAITIDTDRIVADLLQEPEVLGIIAETFGEELVEGGVLKKAALADLIFQAAHLRISLEDILHPRVFRRIAGELDRIGRDSLQVVIVEAPILFERGYQNRFDEIITVFAPEEIALSRLREKGITEEEARRRMESQLPIAIKKRGADFVIDNSGDLENTRSQVERVYQELLRKVKGHGNN
ncbi:MAG: dephospho-CoA kinase [Thermodesulfovibrionales bacterium]|jgi:dephospho-CoA kinase